ncbi:putative ACT domain-containing protein ACR1-12 [Helianthus annuus]|uniref:ACT domain-containing protein ACR n=1 Tax=Helianthus annuus TaxID=4232 RepID=A0A9K3E522_HELAN|nr:ACT domain-containing protein ACR9-like isoform X1 [Helianthus annuus]XP_035839564.1 ACT domain-containing protein ACR9-like isoform X2 [Helianthus annuus]KAF5766951.1 putative ACT domain-containing protein ACR1-12 [Helianthus annuus]KAJ0453277.1 putative ACT domain-containing protein ACR1-12 [Helianthus annuus]KAJ0475205.1 putative ACT domain-containing protein ACR1-12 [Helianthus annuus]KAJ0654511.1 putative ACT domain-containing protein ACR1-12 [Helianthus annuus]
MGMSSDDVVLIEEGKNSGEPSVVTVNCPDKAGLGCDLVRNVLEFGLYVTRGDFSTDGKWCYIVLWVVSRPLSLKIDWGSLKNRLLSCCPSFLPAFYLSQLPDRSRSPPLYVLKVFSLDRQGLVHDVTKVLCELELTIQGLKVMTTPDGKVLDLFFITDHLDMLHTRIRREETCEHLSGVLGECCISCELQLAGPEFKYQQGFSSISEEVADELFSCELSAKEDCSQTINKAVSGDKKAVINVDNLMSPAHTLLQIQCLDQKALIYDILKISKDCNIRIAYGRISTSVKGYRSLDLFIQTDDGKKILDIENQVALCSRLKEEMLHPLRVIITNRGPDTELLVANPVELSGKGRPRVFYDVTFALKTLGICIFFAEVGRHSTSDREWEVYKFRLDETRGFPLTSNRAKRDIVDKVRRTLMGW